MSCLKCLKYTMCVVNFIFFICGATIFGLGIYLKMSFNFSTLVPSIPAMNVVNGLFILGIFITCVSFLGFLGALKENRCLLISFFTLLFLVMLAELAMACVLLMYENQIDQGIEEELARSLQETISKNTTSIEWDTIQTTFQCCGVNNASDWKSNVPKSCCRSTPCTDNLPYFTKGCYSKLKIWFENNLLSTGIGIIVVCSIEVLGMCFSMTLFCHISKSGLGYVHK
ncbi:leukocyte surface antigen CD53 [Salminus brasiliensis]|uniref:leukocyte surface antigen CD53 n=1 Tax=Salminus brasiliensis TaxID=930266 RepID=UPI003B838171